MKSLYKDPKIKKGTIIGRNWFFIVINATPSGVECLCDNANNIYSFTWDHLITSKEPNEWVIINLEDQVNHDFLWGLDDKYDHLKERSIPFEVAAEVMSGLQDSRCDHWHGKI